MILVTGGTGLVGSHLLYELTQKHESVKAIYRNEKKLSVVKKVFSYYSKQPDEDFNKIEWIQVDLLDIPLLIEAFKNVSHVYHCAAFVSFEPNKYHELRKTNIEGTANIVKDRKSTRLNSSHVRISYAVFCLKKKKECWHAAGPVRDLIL